MSISMSQAVTGSGPGHGSSPVGGLPGSTSVGSIPGSTSVGTSSHLQLLLLHQLYKPSPPGKY